MRYDEVSHILTNSTPSDWLYVPCHGGNGPAYAIDWKEAGGEFAPVSHPHRATYLGNVNLTIAWGLELEEDGSYAWLQDGIPSAIIGKETTADFECIDIFWAGALIERRHYYSVSSEHVSIPAFARHDGQRSVPESEVRFLETVSSLETGSPLNKLYTTRTALERAGIRVNRGA